MSKTKCHGRGSHGLNDAQDFGLADQGNHLVSFQRASRASKRRFAIVDCVAFFYEEGKGGKNFRKKNIYMESEKGREKPAEADTD